MEWNLQVPLVLTMYESAADRGPCRRNRQDDRRPTTRDSRNGSGAVSGRSRADSPRLLTEAVLDQRQGLLGRGGRQVCLGSHRWIAGADIPAALLPVRRQPLEQSDLR